MLNRHRRFTLITAAVLLAALSASSAIAATVQTYSQKFTAKRPGQSTGMTFRASQPVATPIEAQKVTLTFPSGTKINGGALAKCTNPPACPAKSRLGTGAATVILASGIKLALTDIGIYNRSGGMVLVINTGVPGLPPVVFKPGLSGLKLTLSLPHLVFPVPGGGSISAVLASLSIASNKIGTGKKAYLTTPSSCAKGGAWTFKSKFEYYDGTSKTLASKSACVKH